MHLIRQHTFDIACSSQKFGKELHEQLAGVLEQQFYPRLEVLLDQYGQKEIWHIETLTLDLTPINAKNWKKELVEKLLAESENYLKSNLPPFVSTTTASEQQSGYFLNTAKYAEYLFFCFLKTGVIPENTLSENLGKILAEMEITIGFLQQLTELFEQDQMLIARWIFSIPDIFKSKVLKMYSGFPIFLADFLTDIFRNGAVADRKALSILKQFDSRKIENLQWIELLQWTCVLYQRSDRKPAFFKDFIKISSEFWSFSDAEIALFFKSIRNVLSASNPEILNDTLDFILDFPETDSIKDLVKSPSPIGGTSSLQQVAIKQELFVANAGLVLLNPFLPMLFEKLDLCQDAVWKTKVAQHKAILLTQFIVTGSENFWESDLMLNKIMCGFPVDGAVNIRLKLTDEEKEKCGSLLNAVLEHWKVMNDSSIDALRQTFLQRSGKLELQLHAFELWVEEKGVDILLQQLPWGIGEITLPWMEKYLACHWI